MESRWEGSLYARASSDPAIRQSRTVYQSYLCLVDDADTPFTRSPDRSLSQCSYVTAESDASDLDEEPIPVERSEAKHKIELPQKIKPHKTEIEKSDLKQNIIEEQYRIPETIKFPHLELTKMKWLTDGTYTTVSSSSFTSPSSSVTSTNDSSPPTDRNRLLSTILQLDREHQMFGLSNLPLDWSRDTKKEVVEDRPVFFQTAIVQVCCARARCRHRSNSDLPTSLKCGGCRSCMVCPDPVCPPVGPCGPPCVGPTCEPSCLICPKGQCTCKKPCRPPKCYVDCGSCYGMKITLNKKPKVEPPLIEITPRATCVLGKPLSARPCTHCPPCVPPSSCFPYLMPCFWPCRSGAPCIDPEKCFHEPPCPPPRQKGPCDHKQPKVQGGKCAGNKKTTCSNKTCPRMKTIAEQQNTSPLPPQTPSPPSSPKK